MQLYNLKIIQSGDKLEVYKLQDYVIKIGEEKEKQSRELSKEEKEGNKDRRRKTTLTDARNSIIRLIKANESDMKTFITLTIKDNLDYKSSKKYLSTFFNKLRKDYKNLKYIWIIEKGTRNTRRWHYHILTNIIPPVEIALSKKRKCEEQKRYENDFASKYWSYKKQVLGFIDIRKLDQECNNIALYVSTYLTKSLENTDLEGFRVYGYSSKTMDKPIIAKYTDDRSIEEILKDYCETYKVTYMSSYEVGYKNKCGKEIKGKCLYIDFIKKVGNENNE